MSTKTCQFAWPILAVWVGAATSVAQPVSPESLAHAELLREQAMAGSNAMAIVTALTTQVGPRLAGSEAEARARAWALRTLTAPAAGI
ncbi:MAG: hypothetical protein VW686_08770, partial [Luminiphilus sp.]